MTIDGRMLCPKSFVEKQKPASHGVYAMIGDFILCD